MTTPRLTRFYGAHAGHLVLMLAAFAAAVAVLLTMGPAALWNPASWWQSIAVWFVVAVIAHDLIAFPVYALADRLAVAVDRRPRRRPAAVNHVRLPAMAAALTFVLFLPGIISQGGPAYQAATGQTQEPFAARWLWLTLAFFAVSGIAYVVRFFTARRRTAGRADDASPR